MTSALKSLSDYPTLSDPSALALTNASLLSRAAVAPYWLLLRLWPQGTPLGAVGGRSLIMLGCPADPDFTLR